VQRVPVKIVFNPDSIRGYEKRIRAGESAVVKRMKNHHAIGNVVGVEEGPRHAGILDAGGIGDVGGMSREGDGGKEQELEDRFHCTEAQISRANATNRY
jgi:hypothetical protein